MNFLGNIALYCFMALLISNLLISYFSKESSKRVIYLIFSYMIFFVVIVYFASWSNFLIDNIIEVIVAFVLIAITNIFLFHFILKNGGK